MWIMASNVSIPVMFLSTILLLYLKQFYCFISFSAFFPLRSLLLMEHEFIMIFISPLPYILIYLLNFCLHIIIL